MLRATPYLRFAAVFVAVLSATAACAPPPPAAAEKPAPPPSAAPPAAAAPAVKAGTSGNYPPFSTWKDDHAEDFAGALLGAFAADQRIALSWTRFRWPDLVGDLKAGRFDLAADGITVRPERSVAGRFTVPVARGGAVLLLRRPAWARGAAVATPLEALHAIDRAELRVGVNRGGHLERVARHLLSTAHITAFAENGAVREALAHGEVDAVMTNTFEAPRWAEGLDGLEKVGPLTRDVVAIFVRADQADLEARLDAWLLAQEESGALGRMRAQYLGPGGGGPTALPLDALLAAVDERLSLMPFVAAAKARTGTAVEDPAQEARVLAAAIAGVEHAAAERKVAPPPRAVVEAFFRAQVEAAKAVQRRAHPDASAPAFSLQDDLRPAIARISARTASLLVRLPHGMPQAEVLAKTRDALVEQGLEPAEIASLASAIAAL